MTTGGTGPELLEAGPAGLPPGRRPRVLVVAVVVVVALLVTLAVTSQRAASDPAASAPPVSRPSPAGDRPPATPGVGPTAVPRAPQVLSRSGPGVPGFGDGDLFVRSTDRVFRIGLTSGRVTATRADVGGSATVSFLAGPDGVVLRPLDDVPGLVVPDDQPARRLGGRLRRGSQVLPGPPGRLWVSDSFDGRSSTLTLTRFDGTATDTTVRENGYFRSDATGGLLLVDTGGVWERRRGRWVRITMGTVLASGPHHYLLAACDRSPTCPTYRYDRRTRTATRVRGDRAQLYGGGGSISPDGRYVATMTYGPDGAGVVVLADLDSGRVVQELAEPAFSSDVTNAAVWSTDGRRLLALDDGWLTVVEAATGRATRLDLDLPPLQELTLRPAGA